MLIFFRTATPNSSSKPKHPRKLRSILHLHLVLFFHLRYILGVAFQAVRTAFLVVHSILVVPEDPSLAVAATDLRSCLVVSAMIAA